jgi:NAD(P)-dependent dehydrogenase (short-subunit alcohol dehydrogenase family)
MRTGENEMRSIRELMNLDGRVALVTGGGGHVGSAICEGLAELGAGIVVVDKDEQASQAVAARVSGKFGVGAVADVRDLGDEEAVRKCAEAARLTLGRLDILVNCAALVGTSELQGWAVPFHEQHADTWRLALEVNLTVPFLLTQACAPALAASRHGSVINVGSIYGVVGPDMRLYEGEDMGNPGAYAASKGGLLQLTRWLATVLAPGVRVNSITPGGVLRGQTPSFVERYVEKTPLGRMATEEDLKGAAAYLASDLSAYVTGHNLVVDGGWTAW